MEIRVGGKYRIDKRLGSGSFGELFSGYNIKTNEELAIKLERWDCQQPLLAYEAKLYERFKGVNGIPAIHWFGVEGDFNVMVMDILGPTIGHLFEFCG
jgi:casein kinase 1